MKQQDKLIAILKEVPELLDATKRLHNYVNKKILGKN